MVREEAQPTLGGRTQSAGRPESTWRSSRRNGWTGLLLALLAYAIVYLAFLPRVLGVKDEVGFLNQAILWTDPGAAPPDSAWRAADDLIFLNGRWAGWRNPGRSLLLLPLLPLRNVEALYLSSLLVHLASALCAGLLLRRLGRSALWGVLVLFHPTLALYSRTLMADGPAGLFLLLGLLALTGTRAPGFSAGLAVGVAAVFRYQVGLLLPFLALGIRRYPLLRDRPRQALLCLAGGLAVGVPLFLYNQVVFGQPLGFTGQGSFSFRFLGANLPVYLASLLLLWPLMLLAPLFDRSTLRGPIWYTALPLLGTMLFYSWHDMGSTPAQTLVVSQRLLQPVLPLWIVSYSVVLAERVAPWIRRRLPGRAGAALVAAGCVLLLVGQGVIFTRHQRHLETLRQTREAVMAHVPEGSFILSDSTVRKLFAGLGSDLPTYRWIPYDRDGAPLDQSRVLDGLREPWYLAVLPRRPGYEFPETLIGILSRYRMTPVESGTANLLLYQASAPTREAGP